LRKSDRCTKGQHKNHHGVQANNQSRVLGEEASWVTQTAKGIGLELVLRGQGKGNKNLMETKGGGN